MAENSTDIPISLSGDVDPCGDFGPNQRWALVWFVAIVIGGMVLTWKLASTDRWMWENNAEFLDYQAYSENRTAFTTVGTGSVDPRAHGTYAIEANNAIQASVAAR